MKTRRLIIFDGISGSGKSTLEDGYRESNQYHDYTIHRFTPSKWVYSNMYKREIDYFKLEEDEFAIQRIFPTYYILITCSPDICLRRKLDMNDKNIEPNLARAQHLFLENYYNYTKLRRRMIINTEKTSVSDCILKISRFVNEL